MKKTIIGVMGGGKASEVDFDNAYRLGKLIAERGWVLLNGGRAAGIMEASARGAKESGGLTVGVLPDKDGKRSSESIDIQIITGIGDARNYVNVLSSNVIVACPGEAGTISEIALALKNSRPVVLLNFDIVDIFKSYEQKGLILSVKTPEEAIHAIDRMLTLADKPTTN